MKIRLGLVTNSSSSSYVICVKKDFLDSLDLSNPLIAVMNDFIKSHYANDEYPCIENINLLDEFFQYEYEYDTIEEMLKDGEWVADRYIWLKELIDSGYIAFLKDVDQHENAIISMYSAIHDGKNIIVEGV